MDGVFVCRFQRCVRVCVCVSCTCARILQPGASVSFHSNQNRAAVKMQDMHSTVANHLVLTNILRVRGVSRCWRSGVGRVRRFTAARGGGGNTDSFYFIGIIYLTCLRRETTTKGRLGKKQPSLISLFVNCKFPSENDKITALRVTF